MTGKDLIIYILQNNLVDKAYVDLDGEEDIAKYIVENKVSTIICGGISPNAMQTLFDAGVKVIPGASGDVNVAISSLI